MNIMAAGVPRALNNWWLTVLLPLTGVILLLMFFGAETVSASTALYPGTQSYYQPGQGPTVNPCIAGSCWSTALGTQNAHQFYPPQTTQYNPEANTIFSVPGASCGTYWYTYVEGAFTGTQGEWVYIGYGPPPGNGAAPAWSFNQSQPVFKSGFPGPYWQKYGNPDSNPLNATTNLAGEITGHVTVWTGFVMPSGSCLNKSPIYEDQYPTGAAVMDLYVDNTPPQVNPLNVSYDNTVPVNPNAPAGMTFNGGIGYLTGQVNMNAVTSNWTLSAWIYPQANPQLSETYQMISYVGSPGNGYGLALGSNNGITELSVYDNNTGAYWSGAAYPSSCISSWCLVTATDNAGTVTFYVNGASEATITAVNPFTAPNNDFQIGEYPNGAPGQDFFEGYMSNVGVWSSTLTATQVASLDTAGCNQFIPTGCWPLTEPSGSTAADVSGNSFNLSIAGAIDVGNQLGPFSGTTAFGFNLASYAYTYTPVQTTTSAFTLSAWIQPKSATANTVSEVVVYNGQMNSNGYGLGLLGYTGTQIPVYDLGLVYNNDIWIDSNYALPNYCYTQWCLVTLAYNGSELIWYLNGTQVATISGTWGINTPTGWTTIGIPGFYGNSTYTYSGNIGQVGIWGTALSATDVNSLYTNSGAAQFSPSAYWIMNDSGGQTVADSSGNSNTAHLSPSANIGVPYGGIALSSAAGPITTASGDTSATFDGSTGYIQTQYAVTGPNIYSIAAWFKTTASNGGIIAQFTNTPPNGGGPYDRELYVGTDGNLYFGECCGVTTINTSTPVNNGQWHFAVGVSNGSTMALYLDGALVNTLSFAENQNFVGNWFIGAGSPGGWPNTGNGYFNGQLSQVAVYDNALSASQISDLYQYAGYGTQGTGQPTYASTVLSYSPVDYWPLQDPAASPIVQNIAPNPENVVTEGYTPGTGVQQMQITYSWQHEPDLGNSSPVNPDFYRAGTKEYFLYLWTSATNSTLSDSVPTGTVPITIMDNGRSSFSYSETVPEGVYPHGCLVAEDWLGNTQASTVQGCNATSTATLQSGGSGPTVFTPHLYFQGCSTYANGYTCSPSAMGGLQGSDPANNIGIFLLGQSPALYSCWDASPYVEQNLSGYWNWLWASDFIIYDVTTGAVVSQAQSMPGNPCTSPHYTGVSGGWIPFQQQVLQLYWYGPDGHLYATSNYLYETYLPYTANITMTPNSSQIPLGQNASIAVNGSAVSGFTFTAMSSNLFYYDNGGCANCWNGNSSPIGTAADWPVVVKDLTTGQSIECMEGGMASWNGCSVGGLVTFNFASPPSPGTQYFQAFVFDNHGTINQIGAPGNTLLAKSNIVSAQWVPNPISLLANGQSGTVDVGSGQSVGLAASTHIAISSGQEIIVNRVAGPATGDIVSQVGTACTSGSACPATGSYPFSDPSVTPVDEAYFQAEVVDTTTGNVEEVSNIVTVVWVAPITGPNVSFNIGKSPNIALTGLPEYFWIQPNSTGPSTDNAPYPQIQQYTSQGNTYTITPSSIQWNFGDGRSKTTPITPPSTGNLIGGVTSDAAPGPILTDPTSSSMAFDGSTGYITTPYVPAATSSYSIAAWVKPAVNSSNQVIVSNRDNNTGSTPFTLADTNGQFFFGLDDANEINGVLTNTSYSTGSWYYVVGVWNGTSGQGFSNSQLTIYVNGVAVATNADSNGASFTAPTAANGQESIGSNLSGWSTFNGDISQVAIFPSDLSSTQVASLYQDAGYGTQISGQPTYGAQIMADQPSAYWPMNDPSGSLIAADYANAASYGIDPTTVFSTSGNYTTGPGAITHTYQTATSNSSYTVSATLIWSYVETSNNTTGSAASTPASTTTLATQQLQPQYLGSGGCAFTASPSSPQGAGAQEVLTDACLGQTQYWFGYLPPAAPSSATPTAISASWGTSNTGNWNTTGLASGVYTLIAKSSQAGSGQCASGDNTCVITQIDFTIGVCTDPAISTSPASPQLAGQSITISATSTCGGATPEYYFQVTSPSGSVTTLGSGWSTTSSAVWTTTSATPSGQYQIEVEVYPQGGSSADISAATIPYQIDQACSTTGAQVEVQTTSGQTINSTIAGDTVNVTGVVNCPVGTSPTYAFYYTPSGGTTLTPISGSSGDPWVSSSTVPWSTAGLANGSYTITMQVSSVGGTTPDAGLSDITTNFSIGAWSVTLSAAATTINADQTDTLTATLPSTLTGTGYSVQLYAGTPTSSQGAVGSACTSGDACAFLISESQSGSFSFYAVLTANTTYTSNVVTITVVPTCTQPVISGSPFLQAAVGTTVTFTASATCTSGAIPNYQFTITPPGGSATVVQAFSTTATYTWNTTGDASGAYTIQVDVMASGQSGTQGAATTQYYLDPPNPTAVCSFSNFTNGSAAVQVNPSESAPAGSTVNIQASASCTSGATPQYEYSYTYNGSQSLEPSIYQQDGATGFWPLSETSLNIAHDLSGNGNNGTWYYGVSDNATTSPRGLPAMSFSGGGYGGGYIATPYAQPSTTGYTMALWFQSSSPTSQQVLMSSWDKGALNYTFALTLNGTNSGGLQFLVNGLGGIQTTATNFDNGQWYYVVATWSAPAGTSFNPSQMTLYVDGAVVTTTNLGSGGEFTSPVPGGGAMDLGSNGANWNYYNGDLAQVTIFPTALTPTQVNALYADG